jgi:hypothetical protein
MKAKELRELNDGELSNRLREAKEELFTVQPPVPARDRPARELVSPLRGTP